MWEEGEEGNVWEAWGRWGGHEEGGEVCGDGGLESNSE